MKPANKI